jgi:hypothetical protein
MARTATEVAPASETPHARAAESPLLVPEKISGGHLVAKALEAEGVDTILTLCGGHIIDIYDGCVDEGIRVVDVDHEQVAAHAADGYARVTGRPGCAVVTAGPGTTDAVTGVTNGFRAESPMLLIGGQGALNQRDERPRVWVDPLRVRTRNHEPDDVQVVKSFPLLPAVSGSRKSDRRRAHGKGTGRRPCP